jgi:hypothetical protein
MLTDGEFMVLYAHQTQRFPVGPIQILMKDFSEKTLNEWFNEVDADAEDESESEGEDQGEEESQETEVQDVQEEETPQETDRLIPGSSADEATPDDDQKESNAVDASANSVEEDHTGLIQSIRLVESEGEGESESNTKTNIPRNKSNESITSTNSEPICGSMFDYVK